MLATDTLGEEKHRSSIRLFCDKARIIFIGFDITRRESFDACQLYFEDIITNGERNWLLVLVGNKTDLVDQRQVTSDVVRDYLNSVKARFPERTVLYFETSAKTGEGVKELFESSLRTFVQMQGESFDSLLYPTNINETPESKKQDKCTIC